VKKLRIVFSTNNDKRSFWGGEEKLGGAWYSYLSLAEELAKLGHTVISFHNTPKESYKQWSNGVWSEHRKYLKEFLENHEVDIYIGEREMPILRKRYNIKVVCYHSHNTPDAEHPKRFLEWLKIGSIDKVIFVSNWHRGLAKKLDDDVCYVIPNGTRLLTVKGEKKKNRLIWASNPTRGLSVLANEIFPEVQKRIPDIELHVAGGFEIYNYTLNEAKRKNEISYSCLFKDWKNKVFKKGMRWYGALGQSELAQFFHEGTLLVYPLTNRSETGSIVAVQSMAYLTPVITKADCVFPELVGGGIEARGLTLPKGVGCSLWAQAIETMLTSEKMYKQAQVNCRKWREKYLWHNIAEQVEKDFKRWCK